MESAARDLPKLWFDPTGGYSDMPGDGDNDCDCDCRGDSASLSLRSTQPETTIALAWEQRLRQRQPLHMQALGAGYWLLADPLGTGRVAVLDDSCRAVFEQFQRSARQLNT